MLWHPKTLQNLAMYNVFFIFGRFSIAGKLPKWPKIPFQYPLALRHPKILEKCRKHHRILVSVRNRFWPPPAKADIATAILTNVIEHLVLLFCPPISTPSPPKRCGRILLSLQDRDGCRSHCDSCASQATWHLASHKWVTGSSDILSMNLPVQYLHLTESGSTPRREIARENSHGQICFPKQLDSQGYLDNSFDTIAGFGANGAIVHYVAQVARRCWDMVGETEVLGGTESIWHGLTWFDMVWHWLGPQLLRLQTRRLLEPTSVLSISTERSDTKLLIWHRLERNQGTDSFLLLDSGAQYVDGTTDVTRNQAACDFSLKVDL